MTPPKRFRHAGLDWQIEVVKSAEFRDGEGNDLWGRAEHEKCRIQLKAVHPQLQKKVLWHELGHVANPEATEEEIRALEVMYGLLLDNPPLRRFLFGAN